MPAITLQDIIDNQHNDNLSATNSLNNIVKVYRNICSVITQYDQIQLPSTPSITSYSMNLMCVSHNNKYLFMASYDRVTCYPLDIDNIPIDRSFKLSYNTSHQHIITNIKTGIYHNHAILCITDTDCGVTVYNIDDLVIDSPYHIYTIRNDDWSDNQAWSIDISNDYIAVGTNGRTVFFINDLDSGNVAYTSDLHDNNVPCVAFSSNQLYLLSASIDSKIRLIDTSTGHTIESKQPSYSIDIDRQHMTWGWCVKTIQSQHIHQSFMTSKQYSNIVSPTRSSADTIHSTNSLLSQLAHTLEPTTDNMLRMLYDRITQMRGRHSHRQRNELNRDVTMQQPVDDNNTAVDDASTSNSNNNNSSQFDDLVLYGTKLDLYLLDSNLNALCKIINATVHRPSLVQQKRLQFIHVLDKLSCVLVASVDSDQLTMYHIVQHTDNKHTMLKVCNIPEQQVDKQITGVQVINESDNNSDTIKYKLYISYHQTTISCYTIQPSIDSVNNVQCNNSNVQSIYQLIHSSNVL